MNVVCLQALWHVSTEDEIRCPLRHHNCRNIQISRRNERKYARVRNPEKVEKKLKKHFSSVFLTHLHESIYLRFLRPRTLSLLSTTIMGSDPSPIRQVPAMWWSVVVMDL
jgi:hypothetical protein